MATGTNTTHKTVNEATSEAMRATSEASHRSLQGAQDAMRTMRAYLEESTEANRKLFNTYAQGVEAAIKGSFEVQNAVFTAGMSILDASTTSSRNVRPAVDRDRAPDAAGHAGSVAGQRRRGRQDAGQRRLRRDVGPGRQGTQALGERRGQSGRGCTQAYRCSAASATALSIRPHEGRRAPTSASAAAAALSWPSLTHAASAVETVQTTTVGLLGPRPAPCRPTILTAVAYRLEPCLACYQDVRLLRTWRSILTFMSELAPRPSPWGTGAWPRNCSS
jgi:hypothetical protein